MSLYEIFGYEIESDAYEQLYATRHNLPADMVQQLLNQVMADFGLDIIDIDEDYGIQDELLWLRGNCIDLASKRVFDPLLWSDDDASDSDRKYDEWKGN